MKFGKSLFQVIELSDPEWGPYWINYKYLKKKINDIVLEQEKHNLNHNIQLNDGNIIKQQLAKSTAEVEFFKLLKKELKKTSDFFNASESICKIRRERLWGGLAMLKNQNSFDDTNAWTRLMASCVRFYKDVLLLENYAIMNYCGFSKILKKHDKRTGYSTRDAFMIKVMSKQNFTQYPYIVKQLKEVEAMFEEIQKLHSLQPILEEEKIFIEAIRDLNYQASQLQNEENLSVLSPSEDFSDASQPQYHSKNSNKNNSNNNKNNRLFQQQYQQQSDQNQDINQLHSEKEREEAEEKKIDKNENQSIPSSTLHPHDTNSDINSEHFDNSNLILTDNNNNNNNNNVQNDDEKNRSDALLEASIRAVVTDPAPNMQSILTWMHSVSTTGALIPIPATTSYLPRGLGQEKSKTSLTTLNNTTPTTAISGSGITYYSPNQQSQNSQPLRQSNSSNKFVHSQSNNQRKTHMKSNQSYSPKYNPLSFSSNQQYNDRKHSLHKNDIEERYGKKQKVVNGTASETNSLITEEDNSSLHDDNLDGNYNLPDEGETSGN